MATYFNGHFNGAETFSGTLCWTYFKRRGSGLNPLPEDGCEVPKAT